MKTNEHKTSFKAYHKPNNPEQAKQDTPVLSKKEEAISREQLEAKVFPHSLDSLAHGFVATTKDLGEQATTENEVPQPFS